MYRMLNGMLVALLLTVGLSACAGNPQAQIGETIAATADQPTLAAVGFGVGAAQLALDRVSADTSDAGVTLTRLQNLRGALAHLAERAAAPDDDPWRATEAYLAAREVERAMGPLLLARGINLTAEIAQGVSIAFFRKELNRGLLGGAVAVDIARLADRVAAGELTEAEALKIALDRYDVLLAKIQVIVVAIGGA